MKRCLITGCVTLLLTPFAAGLTFSAQAVLPVVGCQRHIELHGGAYWAKELGRSERWVVANHSILLWQNTTSGNRGGNVGKMHVGSRAVILDEDSEAYRVRSPLDRTIGWVSKIQVARTVDQDVETRKPCVR